MIAYDYSKLRGLIKEKFGTEGAFAKALGRTHNFVSQVFNGYTFFTQNDIEKAVELLSINPEMIGEYFFKKKVHDTEQDEETE